MKVKAIKAGVYLNANLRAITMNAGDVFETSPYYARDLIERGILAPAQNAPQEDLETLPADKAIKEMYGQTVSIDELKGMSYRDLRKLATLRGITPVPRKKKAVIDAIVASMTTDQNA